MPPKTLLTAVLCALALATAQAQWDLKDSHSTASLRGVSNPGGRAVWASGTRGTVLRSVDDGNTWQTCPVPPNAERLDFRGLQAFDKDTAIVMSSGTGDLSRIYKTTDGCQTWKLLFSNPEKEGFWDAIYFLDPSNGILFGDPATGFAGDFALRLRVTHDGGQTWAPITDPESHAPGKNLMPVAREGFFAASNSNATSADGWLWMGTGRGRIFRRRLYSRPANKAAAFQAISCAGAMEIVSHSCGIPWIDWQITDTTPLTRPDPGEASGVFSIHFRNAKQGIAVGGDYTKPNATTYNAAWSTDGGKTWQAPATPPHGFRSAIAYDAKRKLWITVGPNGTDISTDGGKNWHPLQTSASDPANSDHGWNALALPFVVGERGRIARLRPIVP